MFGNFSTMDISASGLTAERLRMEVTANNIANANTTKTASGEPFRRQTVVFSAMLDDAAGLTTTGKSMQGVQIVGIESDPSEFPEVYRKGHPHADEDGMLRIPNVSIPNEMVDLITASRSYEANLKSMSLFKEMVEQTLTLLQGGR